MRRPVRFCGVCGVRVKAASPTYGDPIAYCGTHGPLVARADSPPPDPLERLPSTATELRRQVREHERDESRGE